MSTTTLTRRAAIAGLATVASSAALAAPAINRRPHEMAALIEEHRAAYIAFDESVDVSNRIEATLSVRRRIEVPLSVMRDGQCGGGFMELGPIPAETIAAYIRSKHEQLRAVHCSKWSATAVPEHHAAMVIEIDASEKRALGALQAAIAADEQRIVNSGRPEAISRRDQASAFEAEARLALLLRQPVDAIEAKLKTDYLASAIPFREGWCEEDDFVAALIAKLSEVA